MAETYHDWKLPRQAPWMLAAAVSLATLLKLWLAWKTKGTLDLPAYQDHLGKIREFGAAAYSLPGIFGNPLNVPPFAVRLVQAAEYLASHIGLQFGFWFRLPCIVADLGSLWLVWKICNNSPQIKVDFAGLLLLALCPLSIMISGIHGNLDPPMIFMVLLSVFLISNKRSTWFAAIALGMAMNIKVAPIIFAPALLFYLPTMRLRLQFCGTALAVFVVGSLPYLLQSPIVVGSAMFGHAGMYSHWGWSLLLVLAQHQMPFARENGFHPPGAHGSIALLGKYGLLASILALSIWMNRKKNRPPLFVQCGLIAFLFMFLTPGFGAQYLSWLVPWVVAVGWRPTVVFYATSGAYLLAAYGCVAQVFGCDSYLYLGLVCWASIPLVLFAYRDIVSGNTSTAKIRAPD